MKRILVGVDGSNESKAALHFVVSLAPALRADVRLLHVVPEHLSSPSATDPVPPAVRTARALLHASAAENPIGRDLPGTQILIGRPGQAIADAALATEVVMVAVGGRGAGRAVRVLLGSTSDQVAQLCAKPVLVLKQEARIPRAGLRILVGIDGSAESFAAASEAAGIAAATGAGLRLALVDEGPAAGDRRSFEEALLRAAGARAESSTVVIEKIILQGKPAEELADAAHEADVALVVVGHRGRGAIARLLLGSTADRLVQIADVPVLVVH